MILQLVLVAKLNYPEIPDSSTIRTFRAVANIKNSVSML